MAETVADRQPPWLSWALAVSASAITSAALLSTRPARGEVTVGWQGWLLAPCLGLLLLLMGRRQPMITLLVSVAVVFAYYVSGRPAIGFELLLAPALVNAAERGWLRLAAVVAVATVVVAYINRILLVGQDLRILGVQLVTTVVVMIGALACGEAFRVRYAWRVEVERAHRAELEAERRELAGQIDAERQRIARDIHDVLGHTLVVVGQQAAIARATVHDDPAQARAALDVVVGTARRARSEVRDAVYLLRSEDGDALTPTPGLAELPDLVDRTRAGGLAVRLQVDDLPTLGTAVDTTAYRIVQEALTNVHRHSDATEVTITVGTNETRLLLTIADNGRPSTPLVPGAGIRGMTERAALVGGSLTVTNGPHGVSVDATLPSRAR